MKGKYIIFEGADGVGKSKLALRMAGHLKAAYMFEPYRGDDRTPVLNEIYNICLSKSGYDDLTMVSRELLLLTGRQISNEKLVLPTLDEGKIVVTDRSYISGMVYAAMEGMEYSEWLGYAKAFNILTEPDLIILVVNKDSNPDGSGNDRYDNNGRQFFESVSSRYHCAIEYLRSNLNWRDTQIVVFENDFKFSQEENFDRLLLKLDDANHADPKKLIQAASTGDIDVVRSLLENGSDVHVCDDAALRGTAFRGHTEIVKILLEHGADVHAEDDYALRWAADKGHTEVVKLLLENGADVHVWNDEALRLAASNGHLEIVKLLLEYGADVHACDDIALSWAASFGHLEVVKLLLANGADVHAKGDYAFRWADYNGHLEVVKLLRKHSETKNG